MRMIGVDFGKRRIGLAVSDPDGQLATPRSTLVRRRGKRPPVEPIEALAKEVDARAIVIGLPLSTGGDETEWCGEVRRFGEMLADRLELAVHYQDERFTSARAERALRRADLGGRIRDDKGVVDAAAATMILQAWLDGRKAQTTD